MRRSKHPPSHDPADQGGFALVEVIVSAVLVIMIAGGALMSVQASGRTAAEERHRAQAHGIAQEDQARMRAFRISDLSNYVETRSVGAGDSSYEIESRAEFVTDSTGTASCEQGTASPDYIRISSTVTWPSIGSRPPVLLQSIVAPPNGSIAADRGALAVAVKGGQDQPIPGVGFSGAGPGSFNGATSSNGCVIFGNLPAGNYTLTPSAPDLVDHNGEPPAPLPAGVVALSTNTLVLQLDEPGALEVEFTTKVDGSLVSSSADSVVVFNTGMTEAQAFDSPTGRTATLTAAPLFPFVSPDTVYAGSCMAHNPNPDDDANAPGAAAMASAVVSPGVTTTATIQLPALDLRVRDGADAGDPGSPLAGASVVVADRDCSVGGVPVTYDLTTDSAGRLTDPGLPWSDYDVCVEAGGVTADATDVAVKDLVSGTRLDVYLGSAQAGSC